MLRQSPLLFSVLSKMAIRFILFYLFIYSSGFILFVNNRCISVFLFITMLGYTCSNQSDIVKINKFTSQRPMIKISVNRKNEREKTRRKEKGQKERNFHICRKEERKKCFTFAGENQTLQLQEPAFCCHLRTKRLFWVASSLSLVFCLLFTKVASSFCLLFTSIFAYFFKIQKLPGVLDISLVEDFLKRLPQFEKGEFWTYAHQSDFVRMLVIRMLIMDIMI